MKTIYILGIGIIFLTLSACDTNENINPTYDYISFETEGTSYLLIDEGGYDAWNAYYIRDNQDQLGLVLQDGKGELLGEIYLNNSDFLNKTFPLTISKENPNDGFAQMSLLNLTIHRDTIFNETDDVNYSNHSYDNFALTINSFEKNVLKGKFNGELKTKTGKSKIINNGKFEVRINLVTTY
ncbi:MAG: hypothetical protein RLO81_07955 [Fulvivirga sp.]|uniref:hypothetical protein n=1 Tax=Fulvivirga sp. TaxID=1931237 RepID=UPI0032EA9AD0